MNKADNEIKVGITSKNKAYSVFLGKSLLKCLAEYIAKNHSEKKIAVIVDKRVHEIYGDKIKGALKSFNPYYIDILEGEDSKSRQNKIKIEDLLLGKNFGKDSLILSIGGGVVSDLAGFVASTFNRGIPVINMPTTFLAMVDASVGGKTAVNTEHGKNLIGAIYQPDAVFIGLDFLDSLGEKEFLSGLVESIKISITSDKDLFSYISKNHKQIMDRCKDFLMHIIKRSIELKKEVVEKDEHESGYRQILNFGHTFGHAYEKYSNYKTKHGFCVSLGIEVEIKISKLLGILSSEDEKKIIRLLDLTKTSTKLKKDADSRKLIELMLSDKKTRKELPHFILLERIGKIKSEKNDYSFEVDKEIIFNSIELVKNDRNNACK